MAVKLTEICDLCEAEYTSGVRDINHMKHSAIKRFVVIDNSGFSIHAEVCIHCQSPFIEKLKTLFKVKEKTNG